MSVGQLGPDGTFRLDVGFESDPRTLQCDCTWSSPISKYEIEVGAWEDVLEIANPGDRQAILEICKEKMVTIRSEVADLKTPELVGGKGSRSGLNARKDLERRAEKVVLRTNVLTEKCSSAIDGVVGPLVVHGKIHDGFGCDSCGTGPIVGDRYMCLVCQGKPSFCQECFRDHNEGHQLTLFRQPIPQGMRPDRLWEVQAVLGMRVGEGNVEEFLIRWVGPWKDTWGPASEYGNDDLIADFKKAKAVRGRKKRSRQGVICA
jgi:hypothetical protein